MESIVGLAFLIVGGSCVGGVESVGGGIREVVAFVGGFCL